MTTNIKEKKKKRKMKITSAKKVDEKTRKAPASKIITRN